MLAISKTLSYQILITPPSLELLCVEVNHSNSIIYCLVYIPPNASNKYLQEFFSYISKFSNQSNNLIIFRDFNFSDINWDALYAQSALSNQFCDIVFDQNLTQLIDQPIHINGNILDLILTNAENLIHNVSVHFTPSFLISSDHFLITFDIASGLSTLSKKPLQTFWNYTRGDYTGLCTYLNNIDFISLYQIEDVDHVWSFIDQVVKSAMQQFIPIVSVPCTNQPIWFNSEIRYYIKQLCTLRRKCNKHNTANNVAKLKSLESLLSAKVSAAKSDYETDLVASINNKNSLIYKYIRSITKSSTIPSTVFHDSTSATTDVDKANLFNQFFFSVFKSCSPPCSLDQLSDINTISEITITEHDVYTALVTLDTTKATGPDEIAPIILKSCADVLYKPLNYLFSLSLKHGAIPSSWKTHKIVPIFKSGDASLVRNYRPISLLSNTSKILERLIFNKVIDHLAPLISHHQFGFMKGKSTAQQLLIFLHHLFSSSCQTDVIYLDLSKGFDTVSHYKLLKQLWSYGITGKLWLWFKSYLTKRLQYVSINNYNYKSGLLQVKSGVPQGSILGPLLFIIYVNDLSSVINNSHILGYADDTKCYKHTVTQFDQQLLQDDLNSLPHWSKLVDHSFNPNKCIHICINPKIIQSYFLGDNIIPTRLIQNDLGVAICDNLHWSEHHNNILSKAYKMLGLVRCTFCPNVSTMTKTKLYKLCIAQSYGVHT